MSVFRYIVEFAILEMDHTWWIYTQEIVTDGTTIHAEYDDFWLGFCDFEDKFPGKEVAGIMVYSITEQEKEWEL